MKFLLGLLLFAFLGWLAVRVLLLRLRRARGEVLPESRGPKTITWVCFALIAIYALLIVWRLTRDSG